MDWVPFPSLLLFFFYFWPKSITCLFIFKTICEFKSEKKALDIFKSEQLTYFVKKCNMFAKKRLNGWYFMLMAIFRARWKIILKSKNLGHAFLYYLVWSEPITEDWKNINVLEELWNFFWYSELSHDIILLITWISSHIFSSY